MRGGFLKEVSQFKYLGCVLVLDGKLDVELKFRKGRVYDRSNQLKKLWGSEHLSVSIAVWCYTANVLPILLFGSKTSALTKSSHVCSCGCTQAV